MAKIKFETGQIVNFNGNPTQQDVDEVAQKLGINKGQTSKPTVQEQKPQGILSSIGSALTSAEQNLGKDIGRGLVNMGTFGTTPIDKIQDQYTKNVETLTDLASKQTDPTLKQKYLDMAKSDFEEGQKVGVDFKGRSWEQIAGDVLGTVLDVGTTLSGLGAIKNIGKATSLASKVGKGAITGAKYGAAYGATGALQENKDIGGVAGSTLTGAGTGAVLGAGAGLVSEGVNKGISAIKNSKINKAIETVTPKLTANEKAEALAQGRGTGGGFFTKTKISPDKRTIETAEAVKDIIKPNKSMAENINKVKSSLTNEAENLSNKIKSNDVSYNIKEFSKSIKSVEKPAMLKSNNLDKVFSKVQDKAIDIAKKTGNNVSDLLSARKSFDAYVEKEFPNLYSSDTLTPMKTAVKNVRNAMNDFIEKKMPQSLEFKNSLKKQSLYYQAIENMAAKGVEETKKTGISKIGSLIRKHPIISGAVGAGIYKAIKQ